MRFRKHTYDNSSKQPQRSDRPNQQGNQTNEIIHLIKATFGIKKILQRDVEISLKFLNQRIQTPPIGKSKEHDKINF